MAKDSQRAGLRDVRCRAGPRVRGTVVQSKSHHQRQALEDGFFWTFSSWAANNCTACPETTRLLKTIPGLQTAFFSIFEADKPAGALRRVQGRAAISPRIDRAGAGIGLRDQGGQRDAPLGLRKEPGVRRLAPAQRPGTTRIGREWCCSSISSARCRCRSRCSSALRSASSRAPAFVAELRANQDTGARPAC